MISYARLSIEEKKGPLTFTFNYQKPSDLSVCLSTVKKLPDQMNCQLHRKNPRTMEIRTLTNEFVYISFESQRGASFTVEVKFAEPRDRNTCSRVSYRSPAGLKLSALPVIEEDPASKEIINMN